MEEIWIIPVGEDNFEILDENKKYLGDTFGMEQAIQVATDIAKAQNLDHIRIAVE